VAAQGAICRARHSGHVDNMANSFDGLLAGNHCFSSCHFWGTIQVGGGRFSLEPVWLQPGEAAIVFSQGAIIGVTLGILAGLNLRLRSFLEPMRWAVMTVPAIIISVLAMLWFGLGEHASGLYDWYYHHANQLRQYLEGMLAVDSRIIEMAKVYIIPRRLRLTQIYLPGIGSSVMAGLTLASGIGVRASILAEFIGAPNGIGHSLFLSWTFLDTPSLFAWILMAFVLFGTGGIRGAKTFTRLFDALEEDGMIELQNVAKSFNGLAVFKKR